MTTSKIEEVAFTGPRDGITSRQGITLIAWFRLRPRGVFHHGDCIGADASAHEMALYHGWRIEAHPALVPAHLRAFCMGCAVIHPAKPPLVRNDDMVRVGHRLLATPSGPEVPRSGTWSTIRRARAARIPRTIIWPDGSVTEEPADGVGRAPRPPVIDGEGSRDEPPSPPTGQALLKENGDG